MRYQYPFGRNSAWSVVCGWAVGVVGVVWLPSVSVLGLLGWLGCNSGWGVGVVGLLGWVVWFFSTEVGWLGCWDVGVVKLYKTILYFFTVPPPPPHTHTFLFVGCFRGVLIGTCLCWFFTTEMVCVNRHVDVCKKLSSLSA